MTLDADHYRVNFPAIQATLKDKSEKERLELIGTISVATGIPIIIVCCYVGEIYGFCDELKRRIDNLKKFYGVTDVFNVKPTQ